MGSQPNKEVLILGCGIFGVGTAIEFLKKGGYNVRIIDRSKVLPAVDAASTDLNKIIRAGDYADPELARLSLEAVVEWRKPEWKGCFHETGVFLLNSTASGTDPYTDGSRANLKPLGIEAVDVADAEAIRARFPEHLLPYLGSMKGKSGYFNPSGGWAEAERALSVAMQMMLDLGGQIGAGMEANGLVLENLSAGSDQGTKRVAKGVRLVDGTILEADLVICATGAWTGGLFPSPAFGITPLLTATGQQVAKTQLTPEEVKIYEQFPVLIDFTNGFYCFPPNPEGIVKSALHNLGYIAPDESKGGVSVPRTVNSPGYEQGLIPKEVVKDIRHGLSEIFPLMAKKDFMSTRNCWYCDTQDGEWLIDHHPSIDGLLFATGGSGHAFKFLPTIGKFVLARHLGTLPETLAKKFAFRDRAPIEGEEAEGTAADHRPEGSVRKVLRQEDLATPEDLRAKL